MEDSIDLKKRILKKGISTSYQLGLRRQIKNNISIDETKIIGKDFRHNNTRKTKLDDAFTKSSK